MSDFMYLFRGGMDPSASPEKMQAQMKKWMDWIGRLQQQGKYVSGEPLQPGGKVVTYAYDPVGRRTSMQAYGKGSFTYTYDGAGRQTSVTTPQLHTTTMSYDAANQLIERAFASEEPA